MRFGRRLNALDGAGVAGQVKAAVRPVPNTGGIGIFLGIALPMLAGLWADLDRRWGELRQGFFFRSRLLAKTPRDCRDRPPRRLALLLGAAVLHVLGLIDDRKALGAKVK